MLGIVKPADALKHIGAILGIVVVLMFIAGVLVSAWSGMPLWESLHWHLDGSDLWPGGRAGDCSQQ
jgi:hypothetical protein